MLYYDLILIRYLLGRFTSQNTPFYLNVQPNDAQPKDADKGSDIPISSAFEIFGNSNPDLFHPFP